MIATGVAARRSAILDGQVRSQKLGWKLVEDWKEEAQHQLQGLAERDLRSVSANAAVRAREHDDQRWQVRADEWRRLSIADHISWSAVAQEIALDRALAAGIEYEPARTQAEVKERVRYRREASSIEAAASVVMTDELLDDLLKDFDDDVAPASSADPDPPTVCEAVPATAAVDAAVEGFHSSGVDDEVEVESEERALLGSSPSSYLFLFDHRAEILATNLELLGEMAQVVASMQAERLHPGEFNGHRSRYCTLSLELNRRGVVAPLYRPRMKAPDKLMRVEADNLHAIDLQVIDVHWLHCRDPHRPDCSKTIAPLFGNETFDLGEASNFATLPWRAAKKAAALKLSVDEEWELGAFCADGVRAQLRMLSREADRLDAEVKRASRRRHQLGNSDDWGAIWRAAKIVEIIDGSSAVKPTAVAAFYEKMTGIKIERRTMGVRLENIKRESSRCPSRSRCPASACAVPPSRAGRSA